MNFLFGTLLNQLQQINPNGYKLFNTFMKNGADPGNVLGTILSQSTKEQRDALAKKAQNYGCPESYLKQIQNFK